MTKAEKLFGWLLLMVAVVSFGSGITFGIQNSNLFSGVIFGFVVFNLSFLLSVLMTKIAESYMK